MKIDPKATYFLDDGDIAEWCELSCGLGGEETKDEATPQSYEGSCCTPLGSWAEAFRRWD